MLMAFSGQFQPEALKLSAAGPQPEAWLDLQHHFQTGNAPSRSRNSVLMA